MLFPQRYAREAAEELSLDERARAAVTQWVIATTERSPDEFEVFIEHGTPYAEIVRRAESWHATLAFVGGRGDTEAAHVVSTGPECSHFHQDHRAPAALLKRGAVGAWWATIC